jgi:hypothetical protein
MDATGWLVAAAVALGQAGYARAQQPDPADANSGMTVLTQGPVHEAFAEPVVYDPRPGPVVPKQPPAPIEEMPPDQKPAGDDVVWIPGYWAWDDGRNDFLWVSGLWRQPPPGRQWVPGYWNQVEGGFQWVPGAWAPIEQQQAQYLPAPPPSIEQGPNIPAPGDDFTWAPGCWFWRDDRYVWRPGYWVPVQADWVWVPAHYVWTPGGYLFVDGYWDQSVVRRGVLFAPVYFNQPVYAQPSFVYTPAISIVAGALLSNLFVRPAYHQYYFGDYYAAANYRAGIYPWFSFHQSRYGYDPIYSHVAALNVRGNPGWQNELRQAYLYRRDHPDARPPRTFIQQQQIVQNNTVNNINVNNSRTIVNNITNVRNVAIAQPITSLVSRTNTTNVNQPIRFEHIQQDRREALVQQSKQLQQFRQQRLKEELQAARAHPALAQAPAAGQPQPARLPQPHRIEMPRSPVVAPAQAHREGMPALPAAPRLPQVDHTIQPPPPGRAPTHRPEPHPDFHHPAVQHRAGRPNFGEPGQPGAGLPGAGQPNPGQPNPGGGRERPRNRPGQPGPGTPGGVPGAGQPNPGQPGANPPAAGQPKQGGRREGDQARRNRFSQPRFDMSGQPGFGFPGNSFQPGFGMPYQPGFGQPGTGQQFGAGMPGMIPGHPGMTPGVPQAGGALPGQPSPGQPHPGHPDPHHEQQGKPGQHHDQPNQGTNPPRI